MNLNYILMTHGIKSVIDDTKINMPSPISNFTSLITNNSIKLSWKNPTDSNFLGVRIQRKVGSYPISETDGETIFDGFATTYTDTKNLTEGATYHYRAFAYGYKNVININTNQQTSITFGLPKVYTIIIDTTNSNPLTSVSYADDANGMVAGSNGWDSIFPFNEIKPVMLKNGTVNYYLNPNNFSQKLDGTPVNIVNGADGDVMIQFPKVYTYIRRVGNSVHVSLSKDKINENFNCLAHLKGTVEKDYLYIGAYLGVTENNALRSLSGDVPLNGRTIASSRTLAEANGVGYQLYSYYQHLMLQVLYLIKYKNLNSQTAFGFGANSTSNTNGFANGYLNTNGMNYGTNSYTTPIKLFGIENLWGNFYCFVDGFLFSSTNRYLVNTNNTSFNNNGTGYLSYEAIAKTGEYDIPSDVFGNNHLGFFPTVLKGSTSTYYSDVFFQKSATGFNVLIVGMRYNQNDVNRAGIFYSDVFEDVLFSDYETASRLVYL